MIREELYLPNYQENVCQQFLSSLLADYAKYHWRNTESRRAWMLEWLKQYSGAQVVDKQISKRMNSKEL